jgi:phosphoenolpyruvate synthase/pyruvate phosphate dikinase
MKQPEYVFPAVVVQRAFASEKSGVMVTVDIETGDPAFLTIAVNEGVSGVVDGQPAEVLRVSADNAAATMLAQAAAPERTVLPNEGGVGKKAATGAETVLQPGEVKQLVAFAKSISARFPSLRTASGDAVPADVEFAFRNGKLALLQIRPFNESRRAQRSAYLAQLDASFAARGNDIVQLGALPGPPPAPVAPAAPPATK